MNIPADGDSSRENWCCFTSSIWCRKPICQSTIKDCTHKKCESSMYSTHRQNTAHEPKRPLDQLSLACSVLKEKLKGSGSTKHAMSQINHCSKEKKKPRNCGYYMMPTKVKNVPMVSKFCTTFLCLRNA